MDRPRRDGQFGVVWKEFVGRGNQIDRIYGIDLITKLTTGGYVLRRS